MAFTEKQLSDVSNRTREAVNWAKQALGQRNYTYACEVLRGVLRTEPGLTDARDLLHEVQKQRTGTLSPATRMVKGYAKAIWAAGIKGPIYLAKKQMSKALDTAEEARELDPYNPLALSFLAKTAPRAGLPQVAIKVLEESVSSGTGQSKESALRQLASLYEEVGDSDKQVKTLQQLVQLKPNDLKLKDQLKQAGATQAMEGGWDSASSYRDVIRDKEKAQVLEQKERGSVQDAESLEMLIEDAKSKLEENDNTTNRKQLAQLYVQQGDYDQALEQYQQAMDKGGATDPTLEQAVHEVSCKKLDAEIEQWQQLAQSDPGRKDEADQKIAELTQQKHDKQFEHAKHMTERYPHEPRYQYDLGQLYWERNEVDDALSCFQKASNNPRLRVSALVQIGNCMVAKNMHDMAIEQFSTALNEVGEHMGKDRKRILYAMGLACEQKGDTERAGQCFKEIYTADAGYRDVGQRLEQFYQNQ